jgi:hypothetical protein
MFEIILLIAATVGIAGFARARGGTPWLWGTLTVVGYFLAPFLVTLCAVLFGTNPKVVKQDAQLWFYVSAIAWVAVLAFCARFLLGRHRQKPSGMWSCPNCKYLNQHYAVICEACKQPYGKPAPTA